MDYKAFVYMDKTFGLQESTNGFYHYSCPSCQEPIGRSGHYKPEYNRVYCFQPGCKYSKANLPTGLSVYDFIADVQNLADYGAVRRFLADIDPSSYTNTLNLATARKKRSKAPTKRAKIKLPYGYTNVFFGESKVARDARAYLDKRGFDLMESSTRYQLGYIDLIDPDGWNYYGYLVIPFHDATGYLIYYQLRALYSYLQRWDNPDTELFGVGKSELMFNEAVLVQKGETYIHEGATDGMTTHSPGTLGLTLSDTHVEKLKHAEKDTFFFMYDEGAWLECLQNAYKATGSGKTIYAIHVEEGEGDPNDLGLDGCEAKKAEAILINEATYGSEINRVQWKDTPKGKKTFRGKEEGFYFHF